MEGLQLSGQWQGRGLQRNDRGGGGGGAYNAAAIVTWAGLTVLRLVTGWPLSTMQGLGLVTVPWWARSHHTESPETRLRIIPCYKSTSTTCSFWMKGICLDPALREIIVSVSVLFSRQYKVPVWTIAVLQSSWHADRTVGTGRYSTT